jgi:hypothetical protein
MAHLGNSKLHTTNDELIYIKNIGRHSPNTRNITRKDMLKSYIKAAKLRFNWGKLDKREIMQFA